jgi:hypothetical protein
LINHFLVFAMQLDERVECVVFTLICHDGNVPISLPALSFFRTFNTAYFRARKFALIEQSVNLVPYDFPLPVVASMVSLAECLSKQTKTMEQKWQALYRYVHELNVEKLRAVNRAACLMRFNELADCTLDRIINFLTDEERVQFYWPQ